MAFFPCTRFENQIMLGFRGDLPQLRKWNDIQKMEYCLKLHEELSMLYKLINKMVIVAIRKGLKFIVENPYSKEHYLHRYWCMKPKLVDNDRTMRGDYFKKPTQYWFFNCQPKNNLIFEPVTINSRGVNVNDATGERLGIKGITQKVARSMIHPDYANRFIREFVLD